MKRLHTLFTIDEMTTDGHAPVLFHCSDSNNYYCKYLISLNKVEINCLAYEVIASKLLVKFNIPTPETALIEIKGESLDTTIIKRNKKLKDGVITFGSKEVNKASLANGFSSCRNRKEYEKIINPEDLIKIAIFDLWVNNADRGRKIDEDFNYNLLLEQIGKNERIIAFDHAFIFGGEKSLGIFPNGNVDISNKIHQTPFYRSVIRYMDKDSFGSIIENFIPLLYESYDDIISETIEEVNKCWDLFPNLTRRISNYLGNCTRIKSIEEIIKNSKS